MTGVSVERTGFIQAPKIAVVNDDTKFLRMMHVFLEDAGYNATIFYKADNAFKELTLLQPDLIVLDIRMESSDGGWVLLDLLTLDCTTAEIPVIVCSAAHDDLLRKQEFLTDLGIRILLKPFRVEVLEELAEEMLALGTRSEVVRASN